MKKQMKSLIIGLVIVAVLVGVLVVVMNLPEGGEESSSSETSSAESTVISLLELKLDDIQSVEVKNTEEYTLVRIDGTDNEWIIEGLEGLPKVKNSYAMLALAMCSLNAQDVVDENPSNLAKFGLDNPVSTVTAVMKDGTRHTIEVGNPAPGGSSYTYLKMADEPAVYIVSTSDVKRTLQVRTDYISKDVYTLEDTSTSPTVLSCTFGGTSRSEEIVVGMIEESESSSSKSDSRTGFSTYLITSPKKRDTSSQVFTDVCETVFSTVASEIVAYNVTEDQIAEYGLDNPYTTLKMSYTNGANTYQLDYKASEMDANGEFYLMLEGVPVIYRAYINSDLTNTWHNIQYSTLASRLFVLPYINELSAVKVETPEGSYRFDLTLVDAGTDDEKLNIHYEGKALEEKVFKKFYQVIIGATSEQLIDPEEDLNLTSPILTCTFEYSDSSRSTDVVSYYKGPTRQVYVAVNGEAEFTTRDAFIDKVMDSIPKVLNNEEISTDW